MSGTFYMNSKMKFPPKKLYCERAKSVVALLVKSKDMRKIECS